MKLLIMFVFRQLRGELQEGGNKGGHQVPTDRLKYYKGNFGLLHSSELVLSRIILDKLIIDM